MNGIFTSIIISALVAFGVSGYLSHQSESALRRELAEANKKFADFAESETKKLESLRFRQKRIIREFLPAKCKPESLLIDLSSGSIGGVKFTAPVDELLGRLEPCLWDIGQVGKTSKIAKGGNGESWGMSGILSLLPFSVRQEKTGAREMSVREGFDWSLQVDGKKPLAFSSTPEKYDALLGPAVLKSENDKVIYIEDSTNELAMLRKSYRPHIRLYEQPYGCVEVYFLEKTGYKDLFASDLVVFNKKCAELKEKTDTVITGTPGADY